MQIHSREENRTYGILPDKIGFFGVLFLLFGVVVLFSWLRDEEVSGIRGTQLLLYVVASLWVGLPLLKIAGTFRREMDDSNKPKKTRTKQRAKDPMSELMKGEKGCAAVILLFLLFGGSLWLLSRLHIEDLSLALGVYACSMLLACAAFSALIIWANQTFWGGQDFWDR